MSLESKVREADPVVDNTKNVDHFKTEVKKLYGCLSLHYQAFSLPVLFGVMFWTQFIAYFILYKKEVVIL